jgi:replication-associated recombination protein RarA
MKIQEQHEDVWSRSTTLHGHATDEVRSVLQKSIRRGLLEEAMLAAFELYQTGPETEELLWRRLEIIAVEDVGLGLVQAPLLIEALNAQRLRWPRNPERWMFSAHAVRLLATARKDRTTMELAGWTEEVVARGERSVEVQDFHIDCHTSRGVAMGRGRAHWWGDGARLDNQIEGLDRRWGDYLRKLYAGD